MRRATAELIVKDPNKFAHHDRVFLNNPVVMQGMGLAPLVVLATSGQNAVMLAVAVALLLVPSRVLACLLSRLVPLHDEDPAPETLQKKLLPRALVYGFSTAGVYLAVYPILNILFSTSLLSLGIYLPLLTVEPLLTYRFGRVQETVRKAVSKGLRITVAMLCCWCCWAASVNGWPQAPCSVWLSAARCCPWQACRQAALSCWACCAPYGVHWPKSARHISPKRHATLWMCIPRRRRTANNERCCNNKRSVLQLCTAGGVRAERRLYPCTGRFASGAAGGR